MILLPVFERELRASARQPFTYGLRLLGVLALLSVFVLYALQGRLGTGLGGQLFGGLHLAFFLAIWLLVPLLTADCISRERREGTLSLLFLTPLSAGQIVCAKAMAQGLRALSLWLAVVPVMAVCLVAGGLGWPEVAISALINFSSLVLAMAAGLAASARSKRWTRGLALAFVLALVLFVGLLMAVPWVADWAGGKRTRLFFSRWGWNGPGLAFALIFRRELWQEWLGFNGVRTGAVLWTYGFTALLALICSLGLIQLGAWNVKWTWREQPPAPWRLWLREKLFRPVFFRHWLKRWLSWELRRNPIGWLERRSWSGRLVLWSWFAVVMCVYSSLFANLSLYERGFHQIQCVLAWLLAGSMGLSAAGSFRRERETGVLELLLVAPLREGQIIAGRLRGLWMQFLPAILLLGGVWLYCATFLTTTRELPSVFFYLVCFATLPVAGLYFSLATANFVTALLWTLGVQILLPELIVQGLNYLYYPALAVYNPDATDPSTFLMAGIQLCSASFLLWRLHSDLKARRFMLVARGV